MAQEWNSQLFLDGSNGGDFWFLYGPVKKPGKGKKSLKGLVFGQNHGIFLNFDKVARYF